MSELPKIIHLCYKNKNIPDYVINNLSLYNPEHQISISDDNDCKYFLYQYFGQSYVDCFEFIKDGPIKADFWRVCVLYIHGGIYCDIDIKPLIGFDSIFESDSIFLTSGSKIRNYLNPIILMSYSNNIILEKCIDIYMKEKFTNIRKYKYWSWSICPIMYKAFFSITKYNIINGKHKKITYNNQNYQFLVESTDRERKNMHTKYNNIIVCHNHYDTYESRASGLGFVS